MKALVIEKEAIRNNIAVVRARAGSAAIYAVLSGDGQGLGLIELATLCREAGIGRFAVHQAEEAVALRKAGFVEEEILMLRSTTDREELGLLMDNNIVCAMGSAEAAAALNAIAAERATVVEAQLQIDAGLGFAGFPLEEPDKILLAFQNNPQVAICGVFSQIYFEEGSSPEALNTVTQIEQLLEQIHAAGFETGVVHLANSYALMTFDFMRFDAVRAGSVLLGRCPRTKGDKLIEVGYGEAAITEVRWLPKGHMAGMYRPVTLKKATRVAVLPVGYENGFGVTKPGEREGGLFSSLLGDRKDTVRIGQEKAKILGTIGPKETLLDVTDLTCTAGDVVRFELDPMFARGVKRVYR